MSARKPEAPLGSALWADIAEGQRRGWSIFTDQQYLHLLARVAERFPGMELVACRPWAFNCEPDRDDGTILAFAWDAESLLSRKIIEPGDIPPGRKRVHYGRDWYVKRVAGGLEVSTRLNSGTCHPVAGELTIGPDHPLAMFLPSAVSAITGHGRSRPPWLRLVVDNTRVQR